MADNAGLLAGALIGAGALYYLTKKAEAPTPPPGVSGQVIAISPSETNLVPGDTFNINVTVKNTSATAQTLRVGLSIGKEYVVWYDQGYFADTHGDYYIVSLAPNETRTITRTMTTPNDGNITDIVATLRTADLSLLDGMISRGVLLVTPEVEPEPPAGDILQVTPYKRNYSAGEEIGIDITIKNPTNMPVTYKVGLSIGKENICWYDAGYFTDGKGDYATVNVDANSVTVVTRKMLMPADAQVQDIWVRMISEDLQTQYDEMLKINVLEVTALAYGAGIEEYVFY